MVQSITSILECSHTVNTSLDPLRLIRGPKHEKNSFLVFYSFQSSPAAPHRKGRSCVSLQCTIYKKNEGKRSKRWKAKWEQTGCRRIWSRICREMDDVESEQLVSKEAIEFPLVRQWFFFVFVAVFHFNRFGASTYLLIMVFLHSGFTFHFYNLLKHFLLFLYNFETSASALKTG